MARSTSRFAYTRSLRLSVGIAALLFICFGIYVQAEKQVDRANEARYRSRLLADELRQSSDDLTRMVRSYVQTGNPLYKQYFGDILAIRDGRKPRPLNYDGIYWDLFGPDGRAPRPDSGQSISLLDLMRQAGFTAAEFEQLEQAKDNSDALTEIEHVAMNMVETPGPDLAQRRQQASRILHDVIYMQAKADIMRPIGEFYALLDQRTAGEVADAVRRAEWLRWLVVGLGAALLLALGDSLRKLRATLGGTPGEVYAHIAQLGRGQFQDLIPVPAGQEDSVLGWLQQTQRQLHQMEVERRVSDARLVQLADYDPLTGLPNRRLLQDRAQTALNRAHRHGEALALMFLDLDRFKNINDSLGHQLGDALLVQVAQRLKSLLREEDTICRLGGDEFVLLCPGTDAASAAHVARKVLALAAQQYQIGTQELAVTCSIGIAMYPSDGDSLETLAMSADTAMYRAKQGGRNGFRFFKAEMQTHSTRTLQLENALRRALALGQMHLEYQPQFSLHNGEVTGAEALLRWHHPELGLLSPTEFIPVAEDSGQILEIGEWVLRTACGQLRAWQDAGLPIRRMAVNLSALQFRHPKLPRQVEQVLAQTGLPPQCLELELTERVAMENPESAIAMMDHLSERGVQMSIDDFGTGYSSLNYLKRFRIYKLKIDKSFVRDIAEDPDDRAIVTAIISMARSLGFLTIAEGVETPGQLQFLREHGCDEVQGYLYGRPLPPQEFEQHVRQHLARHPVVSQAGVPG
ncbi:MAG: EAL domain-containing protein [Burkholderiales bacterium]|nr:EAL domain-containing protein [Burkholderiales bacterium]